MGQVLDIKHNDGPIRAPNRLPEPAVEPRWVDRLDARVLTVLAVVGLALPLLGYLWTIQRYGINVIQEDQFTNIAVIKASYSHAVPWGALWVQHNQNRMFFPNLIVIVLAHSTHFNVTTEEYVSAVMLAGSIALLIFAHKRRSPATPLLYYCPIAVVAFSLVQYQNTLWGFQMAWYLVLLSFAACVALLDGNSLTWVAFVGAIASAIVGSYSSLQGLLIWPVGLLLLFLRKRPGSFFFTTWIIAGVMTTALYFHNLNGLGGPESRYFLRHPVADVKFFLILVGDVAGSPTTAHKDVTEVALLGVVILAVAVAVFVVYGFRHGNQKGSPVGLAVICFGLLFAAVTTYGRILFGTSGAGASRYTTYDLLVLVGIYLTLLDRPQRLPIDTRSSVPISTGTVPWLRFVVGVLIIIQVTVGTHNALPRARGDSAYEAQELHISRHIDSSQQYQVKQLAFFYSVQYLLTQIHTAEQLHLSAFSDH